MILKLSEIKKGLGGKGNLIWLENDLSENGFGLIVHPSDEIEYDSKCYYPFKSFIDVSETDSDIIKAIGKAFGVKKVFAYQKHLVSTGSIDGEKYKKLEFGDYDFYDCNCSFLVMAKKEVEAGDYDGIFIG